MTLNRPSKGRIRPTAHCSTESIAAHPAPCHLIRAGALCPCQPCPLPRRAGIWGFSRIFHDSSQCGAGDMGLHCSSRAGTGRGSRSHSQALLDAPGCSITFLVPKVLLAPSPSQSPKSLRGSWGVRPASGHPPAQLSASDLTHAPAGLALGGFMWGGEIC